MSLYSTMKVVDKCKMWSNPGSQSMCVCVFMFNLTISSISLYESIIYSTALSAGCMPKNTRISE